MATRGVILASVWWAAALAAHAQGVHRQDFEGQKTHLQLLLAETDAQAKIEEHLLVDVDPHNGKQAERIVVRNAGGANALVGYAIPKTLLTEELSLAAWIKANRVGVKIAARVVLPRDKDPETGRSTVLLFDGETSTVAGRWDPIKVTNLPEILAKQRGYLQARRKATVDVRDAYADMLVLNVHTGIGLSDVTIDDVEVGPLVPVPLGKASNAPASVPANMADMRVEQPGIRDASDKARVKVDKGKIKVGDRGHFIRGIRRSTGPAAAPMERLGEARFNTVFAPWPFDRDVADAAEQNGMRLVPMLGLVEGGLRGRVHSSVADLDVRERDRWLAWHVGYNLDSASAPNVKRAASDLRARDVEAGRPIVGHVVEGMRPVSRELDVVLVQRYPLMGSLGLDDYGRWLQERRHFAKGLAVMLGAVQVHPPIEVARATFGHGPEAAFGAPIGPQPLQIELLACHILAAGYKGLVFSTDWALSDVAVGYDRMLQSALLNEKLMLMETFVAEGSAPELCRSSNPKIKAVLFPHERGLLMLAFWNDKNAQYCVGQAIAQDVEITAAGVPDGAQAHVIGLTRVQSVQPQNGLGGVKVKLNEVDGCAMVLFTTETGVIAQYQTRVQAVAKRVAPLYLKLAESSLQKTAEVVAKLQGLWTSSRDANRDLFLARQFLENKARDHLERSRQALAQNDFDLASKEANYVLRYVRTVEEMLWKKIVADLPTPVADPFAVSFYTLPEHLKFREELKAAKFGDNLLATGDFEREGALDNVGWQYVPFVTDGLEPDATLIGSSREGRRALELSATVPEADEAGKPPEPPPVVEHTRVMMISPRVAVRKGQIAKISGFVRLPAGVGGSVDGVLVYDSVGGEALALRFQRAPEWTPFTFYRPIREDGDLRVNLAMTGVGRAQFDDVRVELADVAAPIAGLPAAGEAAIR